MTVDCHQPWHKSISSATVGPNPARHCVIMPPLSSCLWHHSTTLTLPNPKVATYSEYATACGHDGSRFGNIVDPAVSLLYVLTGEESYATEAHASLTAFAAPYMHNMSKKDAFHCYETINAYRVIVAAGRPPPWNASMQTAFESAIAIQCHPMPVASCATPGSYMGDCHGTAAGGWNESIVRCRTRSHLMFFRISTARCPAQTVLSGSGASSVYGGTGCMDTH